MKIVVYGKKFNDDATPYIKKLFDFLIKQGAEVFIDNNFADFISKKFSLDSSLVIYKNPWLIKKDTDFLISIGGDGTILDTITSVRDSNIPILGINTGRLGFLANNTQEDIEDAVINLMDGNFIIDKRTLINLNYTDNHFENDNFALNELTVHKNDSSSMMNIHAYVNGDFLNSYWADGLIIATPTGSTAYSLSCGGPILTPGSDNFVITPIAPHNLNLRPFVVKDDVIITLKLEGRSNEFLATLDSRSVTIDRDTLLEIKRADFNINLVQFENQNFFSTIRNKLMWGKDARN